MNGKADVLGICFQPDGFYPFVKVPVSEFNNQVRGMNEIGLKDFLALNRQMIEINDTARRLTILENRLLMMLDEDYLVPESFRNLFKTLDNHENPFQLANFSKQQNISLRQLERLYKKYVGISAISYNALNRFHNSTNSMLSGNFDKLSDIAYLNDYFDQMHFIRDFKRFAGTTPKQFLKTQNSILHIGQFT
jgi:AraC-like DNA-binding protein